MTLREVTGAVISLIENASGCPVVASEDASLKTLAASRIARGRWMGFREPLVIGEVKNVLPPRLSTK
jgi:hypothetical protein